jgi:hypothetical protein
MDCLHRCAPTLLSAPTKGQMVSLVLHPECCWALATSTGCGGCRASMEYTGGRPPHVHGSQCGRISLYGKALCRLEGFARCMGTPITLSFSPHAHVLTPSPYPATPTHSGWSTKAAGTRFPLVRSEGS